MAGKTKGKEKTIDLKVTANTEGADKPLKELTKAVEKTVSNVVKLNEALETTTKNVKNITKLNNEAVKNTNKLVDEKTKAEQKAAKEAEKAAEREYKAKIDFARRVRTEQKRIQDTISKDEKDRLRKQEQDRKTYIANIKKTITELNQEMSKLRTSGYGAIVNALTTALPARIGTAVAYKSIGLAMDSIKDSFGSLAALQQQFAAIYAITDTTSASMEKLRGTILAVGSASMYSTEQLAQATITLGQAGLTAEQIVDALEAVNNLAVGTGTDLAMSVNVLTSSLAVWNKEASQAGHVSDVLTTAANRTRADVGTMANAIQYAGAAASDLGVSFEEFTAVASAVTNAGLKARSVVGTGFRSVLTELINPSAKLKKVFEMLGVSLEEVDVRSRGLTNVLRTLKDAGLDAAMAFQGFDRRAASFFIAATSQLDTVTKLRDAFLEEGAAARAAEKQMDTVSSQWERMKNAMKQAFSEAFRPLVGVLTELLKLFANFAASGFGQFTIKLLAASTAVSTLTKIVVGLKSAFVALRGTMAAITLATIQLKVAESQSAVQFLATVGALNKVNTATKALTLSTRIFGVTLKSILITTGIGAVLVGLSALYSYLNKTETVMEEVNDRVKASKDRIDSLTDAYNELVQKQKLYYSDQEALINRGKELNKQFELQGSVVLKATDSLDQYLVKLQQVINIEKKKQLFEINRSLPVVEQEFKKLKPSKGAGYADWFKGLSGHDYNKVMRQIDELVRKGDEESINQLRKLQYEISDKLARDQIAPAGAKIWNGYVEADDFGRYIDKAVELAVLKSSSKDLAIETASGGKTAENLAKLSISLGDFSEKFKDAINTALYAPTFEKQSEQLEGLKNAINKDYELRKKETEDLITEAKQLGNKSAEASYTRIRNEFDLRRAELMKSLDDTWKDTLDKSVTKAATDYQNFAKAVEKGESGLPPEDASKELNRLKDRLVVAIKAQEAYETSILQEGEKLRKTSLQKKIDRLKEHPEEIPHYFEGTTEEYIANLELGLSDSADFLQKLQNVKDKYANLLIERLSRAAAADAKNKSKIGTTMGDLLPYTAALYGGSESPGFAAIEEKYRETNPLGRGSIRYGQTLAGDKNLSNFMDDTWAETALKGIDTFTNGFSDAVVQFANSAKDFQTALKDFAVESLRTIGNWLIQMSLKAMIMQGIRMAFPEFFSASAGTETYSSPIGPTQVPNASGFYGKASGGRVVGGIPNRDSVKTKLMPGEYVLKKSAVDYLGENFLNGLNANAAQTMNTVSGDIIASDDSPASVVNVWVVSEEEAAGMGPNDVIATITKDIRNGGQTRQLIKSIVAGRK